MAKSDSDSLKTEAASSSKREFILLPQETLILCVVSALDVIMTYRLLDRDDVPFIESNPFAKYFLDRWGIEGMAYFKAAMTIVACVLTQIVARRNPSLARSCLGLATLIIGAVVLYSVWLHFNHAAPPEELETQLRILIHRMRV